MSAEATPAQAAPTAPAKERRAITVDGLCISSKMQKTIVVEVERLERHPKYGKYVRRHSRFKAHDEKGEAKEGDVVRIAQTRPLSKTKRWRLVGVLSRAKA